MADVSSANVDSSINSMLNLMMLSGCLLELRDGLVFLRAFGGLWLAKGFKSLPLVRPLLRLARDIYGSLLQLSEWDLWTTAHALLEV